MFNILVEDNPDTRLPMETVLELDCRHIDLMITDILMPGIDGYTLTEELWDAGYELPILMVTAQDTGRDKRRGFLVGTDDYMCGRDLGTNIYLDVCPYIHIELLRTTLQPLRLHAWLTLL